MTVCVCKCVCVCVCVCVCGAGGGKGEERCVFFDVSVEVGGCRCLTCLSEWVGVGV